MSIFEWRLFRYSTLALFVGLLVVIQVAHGSSSENSDREARLRAAFVYNFASFTEWPDSERQEKFRIGIWKNITANEAAQDELTGKSIKGRSIEVISLNPNVSTAGIKLIIIDSDEGEASLRKFLSGVGMSGTLTVSRFESHCALGVIVCFQKEADKLRFKINKTALDKSGLKMSSQLLKLARIVEN
jgi:hypothetical protein